MTKANQSIPYQRMFFCFFGYVLLRERVVVGDPRSQTVQVMCGRQLEHNATIFVPNFVATMENISEQMRVSGFGVAVSGSGPDINYGLAQCYGDLSLLDCVLCYAEARTILPQCYPYNGGRIYLDGCFMRAENYSFYEEYLGPGDKAVCGNTTRKNSTFAESTKQAVSQAVTRASNNQGYARVQLPVPGTNESAYVLANCWETLNASSCRACLENATASILGCLPWSEGRALYTGCFMRYSDIDFLNDELGNGGSRGSIVIIVVSVISSLVVLGLGVSIGVYIWKRRYIMKKRRGSNEARKLARTLNDSSLNFKYSTLEKATGSFDDTNKLGQGGFGSVYKGALPDGREIAVKRALTFELPCLFRLRHKFLALKPFNRMETLQIRPQNLQSLKPKFMNTRFSRLVIKPLNPFLSTLKPFCTTNSSTPLPLKKTILSRNRVKVREKVADAAQLKQNWLDSLTFPLPNETETTNLGGDDLTRNNVGSNWVIGVDPDVSGALALLKIDESGCSAQVFDSPHLKVMVGKGIRKRLDVKSIVQLIRSFDAPIGTTAYVEQSTPFPQDGKQGWWSGGFGYGLWIGVLVASGFSVVPVPSMTWKSDLELAGGRCTKDDSRRIASTLFPSLSPLLERKKDHGRAEALLIAAYGKGMKLKNSSSVLDELP